MIEHNCNRHLIRLIQQQYEQILVRMQEQMSWEMRHRIISLLLQNSHYVGQINEKIWSRSKIRDFYHETSIITSLRHVIEQTNYYPMAYHIGMIIWRDEDKANAKVRVYSPPRRPFRIPGVCIGHNTVYTLIGTYQTTINYDINTIAMK